MKRIASIGQPVIPFSEMRRVDGVVMPSCDTHGQAWEADCDDCDTNQAVIWIDRMVVKGCPKCGSECQVELPKGGSVDEDRMLADREILVVCKKKCGYARYYRDEVA